MRKIFIACDSSNISEIRKIIAKTKTKLILDINLVLSSYMLKMEENLFQNFKINFICGLQNIRYSQYKCTSN